MDFTARACARSCPRCRSPAMPRVLFFAIGIMASAGLCAAPMIQAAEPDEITPQSEAALALGLDWLAKNQGVEGSWGSSDLGLVSLGALAFLSAGHAPGRGQYGRELDKALEFIVSRSRPSGLLNIADAQR